MPPEPLSEGGPDLRALEDQLREWLQGARSIVIAGIGNAIRRDDYVGVKVVEDLRAEGRACARVHLKVRFAPFFTVTRVRKLPKPTLDPAVIADTALLLLRRLEDDRPIRLLGIRGEMVPPEGGYDPPRTHGRRGNP